MSNSNVLAHTEKAQMILDKDFEDVQLVNISEELTYDGFDMDGPRSNIWNLYIISKEFDTLYFTHYTWENWFDGNYHDQYEMVFKDTVELGKLKGYNIRIAQLLHNVM